MACFRTGWFWRDFCWSMLAVILFFIFSLSLQNYCSETLLCVVDSLKVVLPKPRKCNEQQMVPWHVAYGHCFRQCSRVRHENWDGISFLIRASAVLWVQYHDCCSTAASQSARCPCGSQRMFWWSCCGARKDLGSSPSWMVMATSLCAPIGTNWQV